MSTIQQAWEWYRSRPTWGKILLAVPMVLLLAGILMLLLMSAGRFGSGGGKSDPLGTAKDLHEDMVDAELERTRKLDAELAEKAESFNRELDELEAGARERAQDREKDHEAIDNAGDISDVDRALHGRDRRR